MLVDASGNGFMDRRQVGWYWERNARAVDVAGAPVYWPSFVIAMG